LTALVVGFVDVIAT